MKHSQPAAATQAVHELLTRISDPAHLQRLYHYLMFKPLANGDGFTEAEFNDLHALGDFLTSCHALHASHELHQAA